MNKKIRSGRRRTGKRSNNANSWQPSRNVSTPRWPAPNVILPFLTIKLDRRFVSLKRIRGLRIIILLHDDGGDRRDGT